jgi:hypothetical protein
MFKTHIYLFIFFVENKYKLEFVLQLSRKILFKLIILVSTAY